MPAEKALDHVYRKGLDNVLIKKKGNNNLLMCKVFNVEKPL